MRERLSPRLRRLFWRSFLIQAVWNYRGMQHLGLLWAQLPETERAADPPGQLARGLEFYNAHPYYVGVLLGAGARLEEAGQGESLSRFKTAAVSPLGAVGDRLFWTTLKPFTGLLACSALLLGWWVGRIPGLEAWGIPLGLAGTLLATIVYNLFHFGRRREALLAGWNEGLAVHHRIRTWTRDPRSLRWKHRLAFLAGAFAPLALAAAWSSGQDAGSWVRLLPLSLLLVSWQLPRRGWALPLLLTLCALLLFALQAP